MADPVRHSYFTLICEFTPAEGVGVSRRILVAVNDRYLFALLAQRAPSAPVGDWDDERADFAARCAQRFCRDRYLLGPEVVVLVSSVVHLPSKGSIETGDSRPTFVDGAILWVQSETERWNRIDVA